MYARGHMGISEVSSDAAERNMAGYRIPPGYHGNAFEGETVRSRTHTPQVYTRRRNPVVAQEAQGMKVYIPINEAEPNTLWEPQVPDDMIRDSIADNNADMEEDLPEYNTDAYAAAYSASCTDETEPDIPPLEDDVSEKDPRYIQCDRLIGETLRTLFRDLRKEDWLLVALIALFLLDGSASPDILILLALLLAFHS